MEHKKVIRISSDFVTKIAVETLQKEAKEIEKTAIRLKKDSKDFKDVVISLLKCLERGGKIIISGVGKSAKIGEKLVSTLQSTGNLAFFLHPIEALHGDLGIVQPKDTIILISYSGNSQEIIQLIPHLKKRKVPIFGLCGNKNSQLAQQSDRLINVSVSSEVNPLIPAPTSSTTVTLAIGDAIANCLMTLRKLTPEQFAWNHPGGSIGQKLSYQVDDLLIKTELQQISPECPLSDLIVLAALDVNGLLLVKENTEVVGLITKHDLNMALQQKAMTMDCPTRDIMSPVYSCSPEESLTSIFSLMKITNPPLPSLPVMNQEKEILGLITLNDISRILS